MSGGADSACLCVLAHDWSRARGGSVLALIVDHGARPGSADEAAQTAARFAGLGVDCRILTLSVRKGAGFAERARDARYAALEAACLEQGIVHLLVGHHAADQVETRLIRAASRSGADGLAGISAIRETRGVRILRPLLGIHPARLRETLRAWGVAWAEDPTNADPAATRVRLRPEAALRLTDLARAAADDGARRMEAEMDTARALGSVTMRPEGFAILPAAPVGAPALAAVIQMVTGAAYPPPSRSVHSLARSMAACTIAGARVLRALSGWIVARERAAIGPDMPAMRGAVWDGRFRVTKDAPGLTVSALGRDAAAHRKHAPWPAAVLATLPVLRRDGALVDIPHLEGGGACVVFEPARPAACAGFLLA